MEQFEEQQYIDLLKEIDETGQFYGDRTKVGRISLFGTRMKFNLKKGFPLLTTKKMFTRGMIEEILWFLKGSSDVRELMDKNVHIWDQWRVQQEQIDNPSDHVKTILGNKEDFSIDHEIAKDELQIKLGSIGELYGPMWRNAPGGGDLRVAQALFGDKFLEVLKKELASDKWEAIVKQYPNNEEEQMNAVLQAYNKIDQIQQLILNLKSNPHSSRHVVSAWFPELLPDERIKPWDNVLLGRQSLAPCHCLFQMYVNDPIEEGGKMQLSCQLYQR